MTDRDAKPWTPFRPNAEDLAALAADVSAIEAIQKKLLDQHGDLGCPDRVAHQYQIAGGKVTLRVASGLPAELDRVGLFVPGAEHIGIGRISTGLGTPHVETNPDFLGLMLAFQTGSGQRVDFLAINDPAAPTDDHRDFMDVLHATAASAGAKIPFLGDWGAYQLGNLVAEQGVFGKALISRMGLGKATKTLAHIVQQTSRTVFSSTAYQTYWTGIVEASGTAGKFTLVPTRDENRSPKFRPGQRHLSEDWKKRQSQGPVEFTLYWIAYLSEADTPTEALTEAWKEPHKCAVGTLTFPQADPEGDEAVLWAMLAAEMGANPGNWIHDRDNSISEPATEFGAARKLAYAKSQEGRGALDPERYRAVFATGEIDGELAAELRRRRNEKRLAGHVDEAF